MNRPQERAIKLVLLVLLVVEVVATSSSSIAGADEDGSEYFWPISTVLVVVEQIFSAHTCMTEKVIILLSCVLLFLNNGCKNHLQISMRILK